MIELIVPQWIAPVEPDATVLEEHAIAIDDGRIVDLGPAAAVRARHPQARPTELPGHLLIPGLVNLHGHAAMALMRGMADDLPLERWLRERIWPLEARLMGPDLVFDGTVLACAEMVTGGITCFNDMYFFPEETARAAQALGMRASLGIIVIDFASAYGSGPDDYLAKGLALRDAMRDEPLISFCLAPHAPYSVGSDALSKVARLSAELSMPVHTHLQETAAEVDDCLRLFGKRPLARLAELGLLGPELIAAHSVHVDEQDLQLMARHGVSVAHCPHSNLKLASGIAPTARMRALGINVGIGTDGAASNNRLDLIGEARTASLLAKGASGDATAWSAHETLRAMTIAGASALGLADRIGSITIGKRADLVAIDLGAQELIPVHDPVSHFVYACGREHVAEVWIDGRHVVRKRQLLEAGALRTAAEVVARTGLWQNRLGKIVPGD